MARQYTAPGNDITSWGDLRGLDMAGVDYSWHAWIYPEGATNSGYALSKWISGSGFILRRDGGDPSRWQYFHNDVINIQVGGVISDAWQSIAVVHDFSELDLFLYSNGSQIGSIGTSTVMSSNAAQPFSAGNRAALDRDWDGGVGEVALWLNHKLTVSQLAMLAAGKSADFIHPAPDFYADMEFDVWDKVGLILPSDTSSPHRSNPPIVRHPLQRRPALSTPLRATKTLRTITRGR